MILVVGYSPWGHEEPVTPEPLTQYITNTVHNQLH